MDKKILNMNLIKISAQLTTEQLIESREFRNWEEYDKMNEQERILCRLEELEMFQDIIDPNYKLNIKWNP